MNICHAIASCLLLPCLAASAQEPALLDTVQVHYIVDCAQRTLPSQQQVSDWTGEANFSQVYALRQRLMGQVAQACQRPGIGRVQVVMRADPQQAAERRLAVAVDAR